MRGMFSSILLLCFAVHLFYSSGFLLDYYINMDVYQANCENRDRPELNCEGKCILAQKIAAAQQQEGTDDTFNPIPVNFEFYFSAHEVTLNEPVTYEVIHRSVWSNVYTHDHFHQLLKPPIQG